MHTNLLYLYKDPRGDGRPLPPFGRGDNLPKATLVERWGLNPWQGAPKGFNELLHSAASTEWSDLTSHSLANSLLKSRGGRFPFRKEALRWENWGGRINRCSTLRRHSIGSRQIWPLPENPRNERQATVDKNVFCVWNGCYAGDGELQGPGGANALTLSPKDMGFIRGNIT